MGCWNETCLVTNTPILNNEKCMVFIFSKDAPITVDDFQYLLECLLFVKEGKYNDYGNVKGTPKKFEGNYYTDDKIKKVFISKEVLDKLRENWSISETTNQFFQIRSYPPFKRQLYPHINLQTEEHYELLYRLFQLISSTRRTLFGTLGTQCQHGIEEEYDTVMELTKARIATYKRLTKDDDED